MDGLSGIPSYSENTQKEKFEQGLINIWPRIYRIVNGAFYFLIKTIRDSTIYAIQQIFKW